MQYLLYRLCRSSVLEEMLATSAGVATAKALPVIEAAEPARG